MGCFSFICKECDRPVNSDSFKGQKVKLFLLQAYSVIQDMEGEYDSYGRVFIDDTQCDDVKHPLRKSHMWNIDWHYVCELMFNDSPGNGIAAIHSKCFKGNVPKSASESDPDQGWGEI